MELIDKYNIYIRDSYDDLIFSGKEIDNYDLDKIFEYYSCIQKFYLKNINSNSMNIMT